MTARILVATAYDVENTFTPQGYLDPDSNLLETGLSQVGTELKWRNSWYPERLVSH